MVKESNSDLREKLKSLTTISSRYLEYGSEETYQMICDDLCELSGAACSILSLVVPNKNVSKTVAIAGTKEDNLLTATDILGFELVGKEWGIGQLASLALSTNKLVKQGDVDQISPYIPQPVGAMLKAKLNIGPTYCIRIVRKNIILGSLWLIMRQDHPLEYPELIELFAQQVGCVLYRVEHEKILQQELTKLEAVTSNSPDLFMLLDRNRKVIHTNKAQGDHESADEIFHSFFNDHFDHYTDWIDQCFKNKETLTREISALDHHGHDLYYEVKFMPIAKNDQTEFIFILSADITARKQAEKKIIESEQYFKKLITFSHSIILLIDSKGNFLYQSPVVTSVVGYELEEDVHSNIFDFIHPEEYDHFKSEFELLIAKPGASKTGEFRFLHHNGNYIWIEGTLTNMLHDVNVNAIIGTYKSIEERKKTESKLLESRYQLDLAMQSAEMGVWSWDIVGDKLSFDSQVSRLFGLPCECLTGNKSELTRIIHHQDRESFMEKLAQTVENNTTCEHEFRTVWHNGNIQYLMARGKLEYLHGIPVKLSGIIWNINDSKLAEQELKAREEQLSHFFNHAPNAVVIIDLLGNITTWNPKAEEIFGWQADDIIGKSVHETLIPTRHKIAHLRGMSNFLKLVDSDIMNSTFEITALRKTHEEFEASISISTTQLHGEQYFIAFINDITERRKTELAVKESERKLRQISETINDLFYLYNLQEGHYEYISENSLKIVGAPPAFFYSGKRYTETFVHIDDRKIIYDSRNEVISGKSSEIEFRINVNNEIRWLKEKSFPVINGNGTVIKSSGIVSDVTAAKRQETELRIAKEQAEAANKAKSEFLANMSHEIRTPMNAILGFSEIIRNKTTDAKQISQLNHIIKASNDLIVLINDILDLSKIEAGKINLDPSVTNLIDFIYEVQNMFELTRERKRLFCRTEISPQLPHYLKVDAIRLRQVLFNLLGNAYKFTDKGGITLTVEPVEENKIAFSIRDTGIGIPDNQFDLIFEAFHQQDAQSTRQYGGTGLGLSITKRLVELLGGSILVQSEMGTGSVFSFIVPYEPFVEHEKANITRPESEYACALVKKFKLLIAEDNTTNRTMLMEMVSEFDQIEIIVAENGEAAVRLAIQERPDLIFMDLMMPEMDGFEANREIKRNNSTAHIPVIAWTAAGFKDDEARIKTEFHSLLRKPTSMTEVREIISTFILN